jgi:DNA-damage-inducible protein J
MNTNEHKREKVLMPTTTVTVRLDSEEKQEAEKLFNSLGFSLATAYRMFIKAALRERRIPFELEEGPVPLTGEAYKRMLDARIAAANRGETKHHDLIEV